MTSIHDLHQLAHDLGVTLTHHDHDPPGFYLDTYRLISTQRGLAIWDYKSVLAHELGHAHYRDRRSGHDYFDAAQERRADEYAALLLIDPDELHDLALWHRHDTISLAADLEVTPHILKTYLDLYPLNLKESA